MSIKAWAWTFTAGLWLSASVWGQTAPALTEKQAELDSLMHSAEMMFHSPRLQARAARLAADVDYLITLNPKAAAPNRLIRDVSQSRGDLKNAVAAAEKAHKDNPKDFEAGVLYLQLKLETFSRADETRNFLQTLIETPDQSAPLKAVALTEMARLFLRQGSRSHAMGSLEQALELDPYNSGALMLRLELLETQKKATPAVQADILRRMLTSNPRDMPVIRELAARLDMAGAWPEAVKMLDYLWEVQPGKAQPISKVPPILAEQYVSTLLDNGQAKKAVGLFAPEARRLNRYGPFLSLMAEAYRNIGQNFEAKGSAELLTEMYRSRLSTRMATLETKGNGPENQNRRAVVEAAMQLGWAYLLDAQKPLEAIRYVRQARQYGAEGESIDLLDGSAHVAAGHASGLKRLEKQVETSPLAAYYIANYRFGANDPEKGKTALLAGLKQTRSGVAWRRLAALAKAQKVKIPAYAETAEVLAEFKKLKPAVLAMGRAPDKFLSIKIKGAPSAVAVGEPIQLEARLSNISNAPIPVGRGGLLSSRMGLSVAIKGKTGLRYKDLPILKFSAPRMLNPGETLVGRVRLDVGSLWKFLAERPIETLQLSVHAIPAPMETGRSVISGLDELRVEPVVIQRVGVGRPVTTDLQPGTSDSRQYKAAVAVYKDYLKTGTLAQRLQAARGAGSLLRWCRGVETGRILTVGYIRQAVKKADLLTLMGAVLKDKSPAVRSTMVASLDGVELDGSILNALAAVIEDPSPLVRFRVVELIGASESKGRAKLVRLYAKDPSECVRRMALAFLKSAD